MAAPADCRFAWKEEQPVVLLLFRNSSAGALRAVGSRRLSRRGG